MLCGGAMEVLNKLGHGLLEKPYENALMEKSCFVKECARNERQ